METPWEAAALVEDAMWEAALRSRVSDLVGGGSGDSGAGRKRKANYFDCLYAFFVGRGEMVEAARAQDDLRAR